MRPLVLLRPEPGLSDSAARAKALGMTVYREPLFALEPVAWRAPDPRGFDALLLTSASALLHAGQGSERLRSLPVHAVGSATAEAARAAGFSVASSGGAGVDALLAGLPARLRLLHLAGEDRRAPQLHGTKLTVVTVYRAAPLDPAPAFAERVAGTVVALHSRRAGERLAALLPDRAATAIVAISADAAAGVGPGWAEIRVASRPTDPALLASAAELCL